MARRTRERRHQWAAAYVAQAREDLEAAKSLEGKHPSVLAMLLQMVFEKLAKGALLYGKRITVDDAQKNHQAAVSLMTIFTDIPALLELFPGKHQRKWLPTVTLVKNLTKLHPSIVERGPQLEYPWELEDGTVRNPVDHLEPKLRSLLHSPDDRHRRLAHLFTFATFLADHAERLFTG